MQIKLNFVELGFCSLSLSFGELGRSHNTLSNHPCFLPARGSDNPDTLKSGFCHSLAEKLLSARFVQSFIYYPTFSCADAPLVGE